MKSIMILDKNFKNGAKSRDLKTYADIFLHQGAVKKEWCQISRSTIWLMMIIFLLAVVVVVVVVSHIIVVEKRILRLLIV